MPFISLVAQLVKNAPAMQETWVRSLGWEDPLEKGTASSGAFQMALEVKNLPANARDVRDVGLIPGLGRSPGGGHGNSLQYSCLENPHGQRSLVGYSPWSHKELDMTE